MYIGLQFKLNTICYMVQKINEFKLKEGGATIPPIKIKTIKL